MEKVPVTEQPAKPAAPKAEEKKAVVATPVIKPAQAPPFRILSHEERQQKRYIKMLVYGTHGSGKTRLAATAALLAEMNDVLIISAEGGELTIDSENDPVIRAAFEKVDSIDVRDFASVSKTFDYLKLHCQFRDDLSPEATQKLIELEIKYRGRDSADKTTPPKRYRTIIIDSLSEVESYCMGKLLGIEENASMMEESDTAEWKHYKIQMAQMMRLVRYYRDLPAHIIMTAGQAYVQDEQKRMIFSPAMTGKLSVKVQGIFDIVGYLVVGTDVSSDAVQPRRLYVQPSSKWAAKCRISSYKKPYFDNPTMPIILKEIGMRT